MPRTISARHAVALSAFAFSLSTQPHDAAAATAAPQLLGHPVVSQAFINPGPRRQRVTYVLFRLSRPAPRTSSNSLEAAAGVGTFGAMARPNPAGGSGWGATSVRKVGRYCYQQVIYGTPKLTGQRLRVRVYVKSAPQTLRSISTVVALDRKYGTPEDDPSADTLGCRIHT